MGWLQPLTKIEHPQVRGDASAAVLQAARHWGLLYLKQSDIQVRRS